MSDGTTDTPQYPEVQLEEAEGCSLPAVKCDDPVIHATSELQSSQNKEEYKVTQPLASTSDTELSETVTFTLIYNKTKHKIDWPLNATVSSLKLHILTLTKVPPPMQKLMYRGLLKDTKTLAESGVTNGIKMMVIGSKYADVMSVDKVEKDPSPSQRSSSKETEPLCVKKPHAKVIEKGIPDDALPGYINGQEGLPPIPIKGLVNTKGNKVRLTFKLETDELWIGTKDRTEKLPLASIKDVLAAKIDSHPEYHFLGLQLGPTERSRYWVYWVPSQYVEAIKDAILGRWKVL